MNDNMVKTERQGTSPWSKSEPPGIRRNNNSGVWFLHKTIAGKSYSETLGTANKKFALEEANRRIKQYSKLKDAPKGEVDPDQLTWSRVVEDYKRRLELKVASGETNEKTLVYQMGSCVKNLIKTWNDCPKIKEAGLGDFEKMNPDKVRERHCQEWRAFFVQEGFSPTLTNHTLGTFRELFRIAIDNYNPTLTNWALKVRRVPEPRKQVDIPTEEEWAKILHALHHPKRWKRRMSDAVDLIEVLSFTGLRLDECVRIEKRHVNLENWTVFVPKENRKGRMGKKQDLTVPIFPQARELFQRLVANADPTTGRIFHVVKAGKTLKRACEAAGFHHMTHHDLRRFFVTRMMFKGHSPATVAALIGHKDGGYLATTVYAQVSARHLEGLKDTTYFGTPVPGAAS